MKIRKSLYSGHLYLMWGASKMKEKPLKGTPVDDKLGSLRSEASHRSTLKSWARTQCCVSLSESLSDFGLKDSGCEPADESTHLGKHMAPFCPLLNELCSWHLLLPLNDRKRWHK